MADERQNAVSGHVFIAVSVDGFIARTDGSIDWLERASTDPLPGATSEDYGYAGFLAEMDCIVMGRGTFEKTLTFGAWPFTKPVIVLSSTLSDQNLRPDLHGKVRISNLSPGELFNELSTFGWRRAYIDGGKIIQAFLREGLIADFVITRIPVLIGEGLPLFGSLPADIVLRHNETESFASGFVQSKYGVDPTRP
ncbi:dihydrofolate reductase family protein [Brucella anthropi]|uniref:dihydrofolate reductase family protein n=1 Tax=Brucella anthropi TaxID=529 RepID=UPI0005BA82FD|nr:dihydrofolate reductase family protein [Brucella anthropi]KIU67103.1 deaminase/reductase [Brucella anthropi]